MPITASTSRARVSKQSNKGGFKFRWWMGLALVVIVAGIGLAVLRFSRASADDFVTPQHFTAGNIEFPANQTGYTSHEAVLRPDQTPANQGLFWAYNFNILSANQSGKTVGGYMGLQTIGFNSKSQALGKIAIFSIWDALEANGPEYAAKFDGEGTGYSTRIKYEWQDGRSYVMKVSRIYGLAGTWYEATITDKTTGQKSLIGRIRVKDELGNLTGGTATFMEYYGGTVQNCNQLGPVKFGFLDYKANNGTVRPVRVNTRVHTENDTPASYCKDVIRATDVGGESTVQIVPLEPQNVPLLAFYPWPSSREYSYYTSSNCNLQIKSSITNVCHMEPGASGPGVTVKYDLGNIWIPQAPSSRKVCLSAKAATSATVKLTMRSMDGGFVGPVDIPIKASSNLALNCTNVSFSKLKTLILLNTTAPVDVFNILIY